MFGGHPICETSPPWEHVDHQGISPSAFWGPRPSGVGNPPYQTNRWWQNLVLGSGDGIVNAMPYLVKATDEGFHVDLPKKVFSTEIFKKGEANWYTPVRFLIVFLILYLGCYR